MAILHSIPLLDELLDAYASELGTDHTAYRNHNYRVANFCIALVDTSAEQIEKIGIACAFHDLGVWTHRTLDYLEPSRVLAREYLERIGKTAWSPEIEAMVVEHHKLRRADTAPGSLVETFRKADWIDVSLGMLSFGLPRSFIAEVRNTFPNVGFHKRLVQLTGARIRTNPLSPMPMMRF
ncbi:MAG: HD domain-containing protein [Panacagrimonas sp.]